MEKDLKNTKSLILYIPENINLDEILKDSPPDFDYYKDCFVYILHLITSINKKRKEADIIKNKGYTPISKRILQSRIYHYRKYIDYLIDQEIITEDRQYIVGEKSRGLRFTNRYNSKVKKEKIMKKTLVKSILKRKKSVDVKKTAKLDYLEKWWNENLTIDIAGAIECLSKLYLEEVEDEKVEYPLEVFNSRMIPADKLYQKDFLFEVDNTSGRLHTWITQLKSNLRKYIKYDGQTLCNVDITNSQPFLAISLLDQYAYKNNKMRERILMYNSKLRKKSKDQIRTTNITTNGIDKIKYHENIKEENTIMIVENELNNQDVRVYKKLVSEGTFYEKFGEMLAKDQSVNFTQKVDFRSEAKNATFGAFFSPNVSITYKPEMRSFKQYFPTVYKVFSTIKQGRKQHPTLACALQNLEADLILNHVCKRISEEYPHIPLYTLHDSIVTTTNYSDCVKLIMEEELEKAIGLKPQIKIEIWE